MSQWALGVGLDFKVRTETIATLRLLLKPRPREQIYSKSTENKSMSTLKKGIPAKLTVLVL